MSIRIVQLQKGAQRRLAFVEEPRLRLFETIHSVYALAHTPLRHHVSLADLIEDDLGDELLEYDAVYNGQSEWKILPPIDHPVDPARTYVTGTGLTHLGSAKNRDAMHEKTHAAQPAAAETDSMKMFRWGVEQGRPTAGQVGVAPEWFYKGPGSMLRAHGEPLDVPSFSEDGGEEAEIAGVYIVDDQGQPVRVGMAQGNEFSDHVFEKKNYLNLAGSKLRTSSIGPELVIDPDFSSVPGHARIMRKDAKGNEMIFWSKPIATGDSEMCHSLANIEHHHFKFDCHRRPGDVHIHFFGACALSFGEGIKLQNGDIMQVQFKGFGRPLRNPLRAAGSPDQIIAVKPLT